MLSLHLDKNSLPLVVIHMFGQKDEDLGTIEYERAELVKFLQENGEIQIPNPTKGKVPEMDCKIDVPIRVPYGKGAIFEKLLEERKINQDSQSGSGTTPKNNQ